MTMAGVTNQTPLDSVTDATQSEQDPQCTDKSIFPNGPPDLQVVGRQLAQQMYSLMGQAP